MFEKIRAKFVGSAASDTRSVSRRQVGELAHTEYLGSDGEVAGVLRAFPARLEIAPRAADLGQVEWSDFSRASWESGSCKLTLYFANPQLSKLTFSLPAEYDEDFVLLIRERIERSIVFQLAQTLPSGKEVRGQVRRNADESLFTQIIADEDLDQEDRLAMIRFESELRQSAGL